MNWINFSRNINYLCTLFRIINLFKLLTQFVYNIQNNFVQRVAEITTTTEQNSLCVPYGLLLLFSVAVCWLYEYLKELHLSNSFNDRNHAETNTAAPLWIITASRVHILWCVSSTYLVIITPRVNWTGTQFSLLLRPQTIAELSMEMKMILHFHFSWLYVSLYSCILLSWPIASRAILYERIYGL